MKWHVAAKSSGIYYVDYDDGTGRRRVSTGTRSIREARKIAQAVVNGAKAPAAIPKAPAKQAMTVSRLFDECARTIWSPRHVKSQATVRSNIKILSGIVGDELLSNMSYARAQSVVDELFARGYAAGTVHRKLCTLSRALNHATKLQDENGRPLLAGKIPMPFVSAKNARDRVISRAEEAAIFEAVDARAVAEPHRDWTRFGMFLRFLMDTACRRGEALSVTVDRLEERGGVTYVSFPRYSTKNDKPRVLPLTDAIRKTLPRLRATAVDGKLFPINPETAWYMFATIRKDVTETTQYNISDVVLHTFRHTRLTRLAQSGQLRIEQISDWAGHRSIQVTIDHYLHMIPEDRLATLAVINAI